MRWVPLKQATSARIPAAVAEYRAKADQDQLASWERATTYWINDIYQVSRTYMIGGLVWLNIRRRDGKPIFRDWRHFQQIKNELLGEECEAVELYPAESRKVDTSNKYVLVGYEDPTFRFPFGWPERDVQDEVKGSPPGMRQRRL